MASFKKNSFVLLVMLFFMGGLDVKAVTFRTADNIYYNPKTGVYCTSASASGCSSSAYTTYKTLDNNEAYCSQLSKTITSSTFTKSTISEFNYKSKNALIAGRAVQLIKANSKYSSKEKYLYITEILNYIFKYSGYLNFVDSNKELKAIYDSAKSTVESKYKYSGNDATKLPKITLKSTGANSLNKTSKANTYISNLISLSGLNYSFGSGGAGTNKETDKVVIKVPEGAVICYDAAGKNCVGRIDSWTSETTFSKEMFESFYVKVDTTVLKTATVKITATETNKSTYPTVHRYVANSASQRLMVGGTVSFSRSVSTSLTLSIPDDVKHKVTINKVNTGGASLEGATLELYRVAKTAQGITGGEKIKTSNGTSLTWEETISTSNDTFFNYKYCVVETKAPSGYILDSTPVCVNAEKKEAKICVDPTGKEIDDSNCDIQYECSVGTKTSDGQHCTIKNEQAPICPENYTYHSESNKCEYSVESETAVDPVDPTCSEGYNLENGICTKNDIVDATIVENNNLRVIIDDNNITMEKVNYATTVLVSKRATGSAEEVGGAKLKICSNKPDASGNCNVVKVTLDETISKCPSAEYSDDLTEKGVDSSLASKCITSESNGTVEWTLSWSSSSVPQVWYGLPAGTYYLVEESAPDGFTLKDTYIEFKIDANGKVTSSSAKIEDDNTIVIDNNYTKMSVSKQDVATSGEIPGALLSICESNVDANGKRSMSVDDLGNCTIVSLADGSLATWTSTDKPHDIVGLSAGTYYLVEKIAPNGYSTAESILFTMNSDGTLTDVNGKSLANNKITMYDKKMSGVETGMSSLYTIIGIVIVVGVIGLGSYYFIIKNDDNKISNHLKIRKRKLHL